MFRDIDAEIQKGMLRRSRPLINLDQCSFGRRVYEFDTNVHFQKNHDISTVKTLKTQYRRPLNPRQIENTIKTVCAFNWSDLKAALEQLYL